MRTGATPSNPDKEGRRSLHTLRLGMIILELSLFQSIKPFHTASSNSLTAGMHAYFQFVQHCQQRLQRDQKTMPNTGV